MPLTKKNTMDLTGGPIFSKLLLFSLPLFGTMLLQLLFNAADLVVVGRYASHQALAAVGSTSSLVHLLINLLIGLSVGTSVVAANAFGARKFSCLHQTIHTAMLLAILTGIAMGTVGLLLARPLLVMMDTPDDVLDSAVLYFKIFFAGLPFLQVYNFGAAILRAVGDTRRPLCYLLFAGILNVLLNLFFVIVLHWTVEGVALATVVSEAISAVLIWWALAHTGDGVTLHFRELAIHWRILWEIVRIGIPSGVQGSCFSLSNVVIQSAINTFGSAGMAGSAAVICLEGITYSSSYCYHQTTISFVGQNLGARQYDRIRKAIWYCMGMGIVATSCISWGFYLNGASAIAIFNDNPEVIRWGLQRMGIVFSTYFLIDILDVISGALRGLGYSLVNTLITLVCVCGVRLAWVYWAFPHHRSISYLFVSYPLSWSLANIALAIYLAYIIRKTFPPKNLPAA